MFWLGLSPISKEIRGYGTLILALAALVLLLHHVIRVADCVINLGLAFRRLDRRSNTVRHLPAEMHTACDSHMIVSIETDKPAWNAFHSPSIVALVLQQCALRRRGTDLGWRKSPLACLE